MNAVRFAIRSCLLLVPALLAAVEVEPGSPAADVYATYGAPRGKANIGDRQLLYYERGEIELQAGKVTRVAFLSDEDYATREARRAAADARAEALLAEGEAVKQQKLTDLGFQKSSPSAQLAFWQDFARRYPGVSCSEQLAQARDLVRAQAEQERFRADQERLMVEAEMRRANQPTVYGYDPYAYGYGYGYGYGRRYYRGDAAYYPDVDRGRNRYREPFVPQGIVPAFSGDPIVTPFRPAPAPPVYYPWANLPPAGSVGRNIDYRPTPHSRGRY